MLPWCRGCDWISASRESWPKSETGWFLVTDLVALGLARSRVGLPVGLLVVCERSSRNLAVSETFFDVSTIWPTIGFDRGGTVWITAGCREIVGLGGGL